MKPLLVLLGSLMALGSSAQDAPRLGEPFSLKIGETAGLEDADVSVSFTDVKRDSRCPKGVRCIVAGEAVVLLEISKGDETTELTFEIPPGGADERTLGPLTIAITELRPEPVSGKKTDRSSYVATVKVTDGSEPSSNPNIS